MDDRKERPSSRDFGRIKGRQKESKTIKYRVDNNSKNEENFGA